MQYKYRITLNLALTNRDKGDLRNKIITTLIKNQCKRAIVARFKKQKGAKYENKEKPRVAAAAI